MYTSKGQRLIKNRRLLIWDIPSDEVILGSDILQYLGIDPYSALDQLTSKGIDNSNSQETTGDFLSTSDLDIIQCSIDQAVTKASHAGLDMEWVEQLRNLLH